MSQRMAVLGALVFAVAALPVWASVPSLSAQEPPDFSYEAGRPLDVRITDSVAAAGWTRIALTYASPVTGRVPAHLYVPEEGEGPFPAVLLMHGIPGTRSSLGPLARAYARIGVVALTISGPHVRSDLPYRRPRLISAPLLSEWDRDELVHEVIDLRRAVDVLGRRPEVDPTRIGFVGHSLGATAGGLLATVEQRIGAYVLMAPSSGWATWLRTRQPEHFIRRNFDELSQEDRRRYMEVLEPLELTLWIGAAEGDRMMVQAARNDGAVTRKDTDKVLRALPAGATVRWYDADHAMNEAAFVDQVEFLGRLFGFSPDGFEPPADLRPGDSGRSGRRSRPINPA